MAETTQNDQQCSFGIKKIVDCKIAEGGKQLYKVKWEATWEPAENLSSCQHLIDEFWSFVNKAKSNEDVAQQHRKRMRLDSSGQNNGMVGLGPQHMLSEDSKEEVQRLIARTNTTQPGNAPHNIMTPSDMLHTQQNQMGMPRTPTRQPQPPFAQSPRMPYGSPNHFNQQQQPPPQFGGSPQQPPFGNQSPMSSPSTRGKAPGFGKGGVKHEQDDMNFQKKQGSLPSSQDDIAELVYICKNCKKPLSKHKTTWRRHYASCAKEFQFICHVCGKGFTMRYRLDKHVMAKHGNGGDGENVPVLKTETSELQKDIQRESNELILPDNIGVVERDIKIESFNLAFGYR